MKVVLDTNVFISGLFWTGTPHKIIKAAENKKITIVMTPEILSELVGVLEREKFTPLFREAGTTLDEVIKKVTALVKIFPSSVEFNVIKEDPTDNKFLACALAAQASFIVSGDQHLLKLKSFGKIPILTPRQFLNQAIN